MNILEKETSILEAKKLVNYVGTSLGNLIYRIYEGDFADKELLKYKNTSYFIIGGSIGTNGYTKTILPLIAERQLKKLAKSKKTPTILTHNFNSSNVGALGSFYAFSEAIRREIKERAKKIRKENKIPLLVLLDVGGTKINIVLAYLNELGEPTYKFLKNFIFTTCKYDNPMIFYKQLAYNLKPILDNYSNGMYEIINIIGLGQPGLIENSKGIIKDGARDLGSEMNTFIGSNPSHLLESALKELLYDMDVHVCNDGIAQFNGLLLGIKKEDPELFKLLSKNKKTKIMYLGLGTGLGSGCGTIDQNGVYTIDSFRGAYKIKTLREYEEINYDDNLLKYQNFVKLPTKDYVYGEILSSKFFRSYMHLVEYINLKEKTPLLFIPYTGLNDYPKNMPKMLIQELNNNSSLLNPIIINDILESEIIQDKAELIVECSGEAIKSNLNTILKNYENEIGKTLINNMNEDEYISVVNKVVEVTKNKNTIHFIGIGKSHSIGDNLSFKFCNLGIKSSCIELTGANAENLTNVKEGDIIFMISNSGKSWELLNLIPYIKEKGASIVAITSKIDSPLARNSDYALCSKVKDVTTDIVNLPEAPTTTTTSALAVGVSIGITAAHFFNYSREKFYLDHPNLIYDNIMFKGHLADPNFDINVKIKDIFSQFSDALSQINKKDIYEQVNLLLRKILASYYNKRTVFITGTGASLHIAEKISATMTSIGIDAEAVNPAQLPHGDFAHIIEGDLLIIISASGETSSIKYVYDLAHEKGIDIALITANRESYIAKKVEPNYIIVGENIDDSRLINIPDQKILNSMINLAIGDAIAVLLAWLIKTTRLQFATLSHQGGAIEREAITYEKDINACILNKKDLVTLLDSSKDHLLSILNNHLKAINLENIKDKKRMLFLEEELTNYKNRLEHKKQSVVIFGMGSMGIAYLGRILSNNSLIYAESDKLKLTFSGKSFNLSSEKNTKIKIETSEIIDANNIIKISSELINVDTVFVSIGIKNIINLMDTIIFTVLRRYAYNIQEPINFIFEENFEIEDTALENLHYNIYKRIENPNIKNYFNEFVGLVPAVSEAIVPQINNYFNTINVEKEIPPLYIDKTKWKKQKDSLNNKNIIFENNFKAIQMRKLWIHNMAHAFIAYVGKQYNYKNIYQSISNENIESLVIGAMKTIGSMLYRRWDYSKTKHKTYESYINWCIKRYKNKFLNDTLDRVGRNPERKLRPSDRLLGPLNYIYKYNKTVSSEILIGVIAAMKYDIKEYEHFHNFVTQNIAFDSSYLLKAEEEFNYFINKK